MKETTHEKPALKAGDEEASDKAGEVTDAADAEAKKCFADFGRDDLAIALLPCQSCTQRSEILESKAPPFSGWRDCLPSGH